MKPTLKLNSLENSYRHAKRIADQSGSSFTAAFSLLPNDQKQGMFALYAFARITDDLGDLCFGEPSGDRLPMLDLWRDAITQAFDEKPLGHNFPPSDILARMNDEARPLIEDGLLALPALVDAVQRFDIPQNLLFELIQGVAVDQTKIRYETLEDLRQYCYLVASTIGIACIHIWGFTQPLPREAAVECGIGFQLTNILRDISEDADRNRIYLPREIWQPHGVTEEEILACRQHEALNSGLNLVIDQIAGVAERCFAEGWTVHPCLAPPGQRMFSLIWRTYRSLLASIRKAPANSLRKRTRLSYRQKAMLFAMHRIPSLYKRLPSPIVGTTAPSPSESSSSGPSGR